MISFVWRTDVHISDKAPGSRTDDWAETVLEKLGQVREVARAEKAAAILDGGDFFNFKSPSRNSHRLVSRIATHHRTYPCPVYCTPGNHDSVYGDYAFLEQQPLGTLYASGVFKRLYDEYEAHFEESEESEHLGSSRPFKVRVVGIPYHGTSYDMERFRSIEKGDEDVLICVAHVLASEKGGQMFEGEDIIRYSDLLDTAPDVYCFGHWHMDQGVTHLGGKQFVNVGSLTRGSLSQDNVQRRPACVVIRCRKRGVVETEVVRLKVKPPEEVFNIEGRARQVKRQVQMDSFVEAIRASLAPRDHGDSMKEALEKVPNVPGDVRERALAYLEKA
jgi:exonuclease SbcD